jgi:amino acid adenylation domain-containing protein
MTVAPDAGSGSGKAAPPAGSLTQEALRHSIASVLGMSPEAISDDADLVAMGIDSLQVMQLANGWRRHGVTVKFGELFQEPTVRAWWAVMADRVRPAAQPADAAHPALGAEAPFPLAPMQQAYWIGRQDDQVLGGVSAHFYAEFAGADLDPARFETAVRAVIGRHEMLRARFLADGRQQILEESPWPGLMIHDMRDKPADAVARELDERRDKLSGRWLDAGRGEVFDVQLSLLPGGESRTHINIDMLVCDAQSYQIILGDLAQLYLHPDRTLPAVRYSFARYLAEQAADRADDIESARAYWARRLDEMPGGPQLPLAIEPERLRRSGAGRRHSWLSPEERATITTRARSHGLTVPVVFAAAFAEVLAAWSAETGFLLNVPLFDREDRHPDVPFLVGDFTNLIMLAVDASAERSFAEQALSLQDRLRSDISNAAYSGVEVLRDLARSRQVGLVAPVVFTSAIGMGELFSAAVRQCLGAPVWTSSQTPQVWLDHQVIEQDKGLLLNWDVTEELFADGVVDAMFEAYLRLLDWLREPCSDWRRPAPALLPPRQAGVRAALNATRPTTPRLLHEGFFQHAARHPERTAIAWQDEGRLSYAELAGKALRVAATLAERGVAPGDAVAVTMPRGPGQITAVLGVLAAGGCYVPVGAEQPLHRRTRICAAAGTRVVIAGGPERERLEWPTGLDVVALEEAQARPPAAGPDPIQADSLGYVIYTSGSTGEPKGVEITHAAATNTIADINARFGVGASDSVLAVSALDFDLSVYDIFGLLSAGGTVVTVGSEDAKEARSWYRLLRQWDITIWNSVPALLDMLLIAAGPERLPESLRLALVSGDWVGLDLRARLTAAVAPGNCRLLALGGATEASIWSNVFEVEDVAEHWRSIPYGYPLRGQKYRVVSSRLRDCPDWVPGELWIGGAGLARGYRGDQERTARQFVLDRGERWYRTADVGRYWPDGTLEFLGRTDQQVKIRGHRIELGEIEAALTSHPDVTSAVVTASGQRAVRITAAAIPRARGLDAWSLRRHLVGRLPGYMIPDDLAVIDAFPLSANGKVDRAQLSQLIAQACAQTSGEPPRGPVETTLAQLWETLLGIPEVGRGRSFFALGGDSLLATRMVEALRRQFGVEVRLRDLLAAPTVAELAAMLDDARPAQEMEEGVI